MGFNGQTQFARVNERADSKGLANHTLSAAQLIEATQKLRAAAAAAFSHTRHPLAPRAAARGAFEVLTAGARTTDEPLFAFGNGIHAAAEKKLSGARVLVSLAQRDSSHMELFVCARERERKMHGAAPSASKGQTSRPERKQCTCVGRCCG